MLASGEIICSSEEKDWTSSAGGETRDMLDNMIKDPRTKSPCEGNILHYAICWHVRLDQIIDYIERGADVNCEEHNMYFNLLGTDSRTPLCYAVIYYKSIVPTLLDLF